MTVYVCEVFNIKPLLLKLTHFVSPFRLLIWRSWRGGGRGVFSVVATALPSLHRDSGRDNYIVHTVVIILIIVPKVDNICGLATQFLLLFRLDSSQDVLVESCHSLDACTLPEKSDKDVTASTFQQVYKPLLSTQICDYLVHVFSGQQLLLDREQLLCVNRVARTAHNFSHQAKYILG